MSTWVRQLHRWLALVFTGTVIVCFVALAVPEPPMWVFYLPLLPLAVMMVSGLYLFVLPYTEGSLAGPSIDTARPGEPR